MRILRRMSGRAAVLLALAGGLTGLASAQPATAGPQAPRPGQWTQVTGNPSKAVTIVSSVFSASDHPIAAA